MKSLGEILKIYIKLNIVGLNIFQNFALGIFTIQLKFWLLISKIWFFAILYVLKLKSFGKKYIEFVK